MDNNKLIAEFMGRYCSKSISPQPNPPEYHTSWDWLMPVIQRCYDEGERLDGTEHNFIGEITESLLDGDIEATHKAVVEIIKWYNENK